MNYEAVYRSAPATPGLLNISVIFDIPGVGKAVLKTGLLSN